MPQQRTAREGQAEPDAARSLRPWRWWRRRIVLGTLVLIGLGGAWLLRRPLFERNLAAVEPGRVYRSAQPGEEFGAVAQRLQLGSVLNLRGGSQADRFYANEVETTRRLGIDFYDLPISATRRPSPRELLILTELLESCRYPLLIHCKWGSDRTGLVSALYRLVRQGVPPEQALDSFTLAHGHVPLFGPERLHEPLDEYAVWLRRQGLEHSADRFKDWLVHDYQGPGGERADLPVPRLAPGSRFDRRERGPTGLAGAQPARAGSHRESQAAASAAVDDGSSVSATRAATSHSSGTSRR